MSWMMYVLAAGAALAKGGAAIVQGNSEAEMKLAQARQAELEAEQARVAAAADASLAAEDAERTIGTARTIAGASGFDVSGSSLDVLADLAGQQRYNTNAIIYGGDLERRALLASAANFRRGASAARTAGYLGAVSSVMGGGANMMSMGGGG